MISPCPNEELGIGPATTLAIRTATEADCGFLCDLVATTMREYVAATAGWDDALHERGFWCVYDPARWRVVVVDGRDAGGFALESHPQVLFLADLHLLPAYQGHGIGSAILRGLLAEARASGRRLALQVLDSNPRARRLYERLGLSYVCRSPVPHYSIMASPPMTSSHPA